MSNRQTCRGRTVAGKPCKSTILVHDGYCEAHKPGGLETMKLRARKGAEATRKKLSGAGLTREELGPLETPADAKRWLEEISLAATTRALTHSESRAASSAVKIWLDAHAADLTEKALDRIREEAEERMNAKVTALRETLRAEVREEVRAEFRRGEMEAS